MKTPRVNDFDPNAAPPLGSPMDELPVIQRPADHQRIPERPPVSAPARVSVSPNARASERRVIARFSYELYVDQAEALRRLSLEAQLQGEKGSMSEMVREAIDDYLSKRKEGEK